MMRGEKVIVQYLVTGNQEVCMLHMTQDPAPHQAQNGGRRGLSRGSRRMCRFSRNAWQPFWSGSIEICL